MIPLDVFGSESVAADLLQQVRWRDGGSRRIEASQKIASHRRSPHTEDRLTQKIASHSSSERSNSDENTTTNPDEKHSSTPSKPRSEINNVLHKSEAQKFVDLDEVLLDRGFNSKGVTASIYNRDIIYTMPIPNYKPDREAIEKIKSHATADVAVKHDIRAGCEGGYHTSEYLYVPSKGASSDGAYSVFTTNRDHVAPENAEVICNRYRRRWDIENQYKSIKSFLPKTSSKDHRIRFCNFALTSLIYGESRRKPHA